MEQIKEFIRKGDGGGVGGGGVGGARLRVQGDG
jgi:hypothetical protein